MRALPRERGSGSKRTRALPSLLLALAGACHGAQAPAAPQSRDEGPYRISVDVELVVLHATVTDRRGTPVSGLQEGDFQVYEDGVPQQIALFQHEDVPVTVGLVVDHSGSMRRKIQEVAAAAGTFARSSNPEDQMFVVNFNDGVSLGLPDRIAFTGDIPELEHAVSGLATTGKTALYDAICLALRRVETGDRDKKALIVISDGGDNASMHSLAQVLRMSEESNVIIYTIGLFDEYDEDRNPGVLKSLAQATGGEAFFPREISSVVGICKRIARDIRSQYTLGYVPTNEKIDGTYRTVRVIARAPHHSSLLVRTRAGYIAAAKRDGSSRSPGDAAR
jgi:Ca-activated chloride channel family protein